MPFLAYSAQMVLAKIGSAGQKHKWEVRAKPLREIKEDLLEGSLAEQYPWDAGWGREGLGRVEARQTLSEAGRGDDSLSRSKWGRLSSRPQLWPWRSGLDPSVGLCRACCRLSHQAPTTKVFATISDLRLKEDTCLKGLPSCIWRLHALCKAVLRVSLDWKFNLDTLDYMASNSCQAYVRLLHKALMYSKQRLAWATSCTPLCSTCILETYFISWYSNSIMPAAW